MTPPDVAVAGRERLVQRTDPDMRGLAAAASRALGCDAVVVTERARSRSRPPIAATHGLAEDEVADVGAALLELESDVEPPACLIVGALAAADVGGAATLLAHGFASVVSAEARLDCERVGAIHVLRRVEIGGEDEELLEAFARHSAVALVHRRLRRRTEQLGERVERLGTLDLLALSARNFEELTRALTERVAPLLGVAMTAIMVWDDERQVLQMVAGSFGASEEVAASYQIGVRNTHSNAARVFATGRPYLSNDAASDPAILQDYVDFFGIERLLSLPLKVDGRLVGVLHLANKASDFTVADMQRAEAIAPSVATVVELARAMFDLRRRQQLEGILGHVAVSIASGESIQDFLSPALHDLCAATDASILALVPDGYEPIVLRRVTGHEDLEELVLAEARGRPGMRACVVEPQHAGDPGWAAFYVPVHLARQRLGTLTALRVRGEPFSHDERRAFARLANLAALAWASERYQQQRATVARLEERQRIADNLHDDVAQIIFAAQLQLDTLLEEGDVAAPAAAAIGRARGLLIRGDTAIHTVIHELSRAAAGELPSRLECVVSRVEEEYAIPVHVEVSDAASATAKDLPKAAADALAKVAREALVNAAKHAAPCRVTMSLGLSQRGRLVLTVVDDGLGVPRRQGRRRHGVGSMRRAMAEHGGTVRVQPGQTGGTKVIASVPV